MHIKITAGLIFFFLSACGGSNTDFENFARATCALTTECYAPGVTPGTNPYNPNANKASAISRPDTRSVNQRKTPVITYPIAWDQICPLRYGKYYLIGHVNVSGKKVCQFG